MRLQPSATTSRCIGSQLIGMLCEWFRPIAGTHQEGNPRPPCVLLCRLPDLAPLLGRHVLPHRTDNLSRHGTNPYCRAHLQHPPCRPPYCQPMVFPKDTPEDSGNSQLVSSQSVSHKSTRLDWVTLVFDPINRFKSLIIGLQHSFELVVADNLCTSEGQT